MAEKKYRHYVSMDLYGNGVAHDVLIVNEDKNNGDVYFIKVEDLDQIDRARVSNILSKRNADTMPLWDVMSQVTLKNGVNALEYFHQLVKVRTKSGQIISPSASRRGIQNIAPRQTENRNEKKRGPGRPPKS
jgi:hypothetical protein